MNNLKENDTLTLREELESGVLYKEIFPDSFFDFAGEIVHDDYLAYQRFSSSILNDIICTTHHIQVEG